jgi:hypothetical protein
MVDQVTVVSEMAGPEAPKAEESQGANERPSWLPENFKTPEDLANAYSELRKDHTRKAQELAEFKKAKPATETSDNPTGGQAEQVSSTEGDKAAENLSEGDKSKEMTEATKEAEKALEANGLNINDYFSEYDSAGELSEKSYADLEKAGFSKAVVDTYIAGAKALQVQSENEVLKNAGIKDRQEYGVMMEWAKSNLSTEQKDSFNAAVNSGDKEKASLAIEAMKARFDRAYGREPNLVHGGDKGSPESFGSTAEMVKAMSDSRYATDEAYRQQVARKLMNSKHLNSGRV